MDGLLLLTQVSASRGVQVPQGRAQDGLQDGLGEEEGVGRKLISNQILFPCLNIRENAQTLNLSYRPHQHLVCAPGVCAVGHHHHTHVQHLQHRQVVALLVVAEVQRSEGGGGGGDMLSVREVPLAILMDRSRIYKFLVTTKNYSFSAGT